MTNAGGRASGYLRSQAEPGNENNENNNENNAFCFTLPLNIDIHASAEQDMDLCEAVHRASIIFQFLFVVRSTLLDRASMTNTQNSSVEFQLYVRRYAPFASFGGGFDGDNRGFTTETDVTSRTVGIATFRPLSLDIDGKSYSTGSAWVGPWEIRKQYALGVIGRSFGKIRMSISHVSVAQGQLRFTVYTEGNLPLKDIALHPKLAKAIDNASAAISPSTPAPQGSPDIDTFVDFVATFKDRKVQFEGLVRGDGFPNAEVFVLDRAGNSVALFDYRTKSNEAGPFYRLFGSHARNQLGRFRREVELDSSGRFGANPLPGPQIAVET